MAPSRNYTLIAFLVAFAVVAPSLLHQSAAARDGGAAKAAAAPAPSSSNGAEVVVHPMDTYEIEIPDLPLPAILPCPPVFPKIPFIPCHKVHNSTPPPPPPAARPKECRPSLEKLMPLCSGFLTNSSSSAPKDPTKECCAGVSLFMHGGDHSVYYPLCLCHILNGDVNQLLTTPVDHARALSLVETCLGIGPKTSSDICNDNNIKRITPPMELPKPPTPAPGTGNKA